MSRIYGANFNYTHDMLLQDLELQRDQPRHRVAYGSLMYALSELEGPGGSPAVTFPDLYFFLLECHWVTGEVSYFEDLNGLERTIAQFVDAAQNSSFAAHGETQRECRERLQALVGPRIADDVVLLNLLLNRINVKDAPRDDTDYPVWADSICQGYLTEQEMMRLASPAEDSLLAMFESAPPSEDWEVLARKVAPKVRLLAAQAAEAGPGAVCIAHTQ